MTHRMLEWAADTTNQQFVWSLYSDAEPFANAINAFVGRTTYTYNGTTYNYSSVNGKFICCLVGHSHLDASYVLSSGVPIIMTTSDSCRKRQVSYNWSTSTWTKGENQVGTINEQAFDVVTIDKDNKKIYMNRVGYGSNRVFSYL